MDMKQKKMGYLLTSRHCRGRKFVNLIPLATQIQMIYNIWSSEVTYTRCFMIYIYTNSVHFILFPFIHAYESNELKYNYVLNVGI